jgi:archaemetzincin
MQIEVMYPDGPRDGKEFMKHLGVKSRDLWKDHTQYYTGDILTKTIPLVPKDAYCMLTITMQDLYPGKDWVYCFGWAMYKARTGVFSFLRYDPSSIFYRQDDNPENNLLFNACHVMVHESGHMFGMTHCTYYECTMNGFNSATE